MVEGGEADESRGRPQTLGSIPLGEGWNSYFKGSLTLDAFIEHPKHQSGDQVLFHVMVLFKSTVNENNKDALKYCRVKQKIAYILQQRESKLNMIV